MPKPNKKQLSIYLDKDVVDAIQEIADKEMRSFSSMLNILLREKLKIGVKKWIQIYQQF